MNYLWPGLRGLEIEKIAQQLPAVQRERNEDRQKRTAITSYRESERERKNVSMSV